MKANVITLINEDGSLGSLRLFLNKADANDHYENLLKSHSHGRVVWGKTEIEGMTSYLETHYEIVQAITIEHMKDEPMGAVKERHDAQGHGGLYELAEELTDKFERENEFTQWDGEFFDVMEKFTNENLK